MVLFSFSGSLRNDLVQANFLTQRAKLAHLIARFFVPRGQFLLKNYFFYVNLDLSKANICLILKPVCYTQTVEISLKRQSNVTMIVLACEASTLVNSSIRPRCRVCVIDV